MLRDGYLIRLSETHSTSHNQVLSADAKNRAAEAQRTPNCGVWGFLHIKEIKC